MIRFALQGHPRPQAAHGPDRARDRPRRRDGERHVRAHRLDRRGVQLDLLDRLQGTDATITGKSAFDLTGDNGHDATRRSTSRCCRRSRRCRTSAAAIGGVAGRRAADRQGRQGDRLRRRARTSASASIPTSPQFNIAHPRRRRLAEGAARSSIDMSTAGKKDSRGRPDDRRPGATARSSSSGSPGSSSSAPSSSIGGATLAGFDLPTAQQLFGKVGKLDQIRVAGEGRRLARRSSSPRSARSCRRARRCAPATRRRRRTRRTRTASSRSCTSSCSPSAASRSSSARS